MGNGNEKRITEWWEKLTENNIGFKFGRASAQENHKMLSLFYVEVSGIYREIETGGLAFEIHVACLPLLLEYRSVGS